MFAGPNGSGKTTVKNNLNRSADWFGIDINPDELEKQIRESGRFSLLDFGLIATLEEVRNFFANSTLLRTVHQDSDSKLLELTNGNLDFRRLQFNSYHASVLSDFLRRKALAANRSFTVETVMSHESKISFLQEARQRGYRTYLYYVATEDSSINVSRVKLRVSQGGHDVPTEKITERYQRSLALLPQAIKMASRAFFFDTSGNEPWYFAKSTNGDQIEFTGDEMPRWFEPIWQQF
jgi:predicted ABC-type ATPase